MLVALTSRSLTGARPDWRPGRIVAGWCCSAG